MMKYVKPNSVIMPTVYKTLLPVFIAILCTTGCYTILSPPSEYIHPKENQSINEADDTIIVTNKYTNHYNCSYCTGYNNSCNSRNWRYNSWTGTYYCDPYYYNFSYYNNHHNDNYWWYSNNNWNNDNYSDNNSYIPPKKTKRNRSYSRNSSYSVDSSTSQENTQTNSSTSQENTQTNSSKNKKRRKHNRRPL